MNPVNCPQGQRRMGDNLMLMGHLLERDEAALRNTCSRGD